MKAKELREKSIEELRNSEADLKEQLFKLRFQKATGQISNPAKIRKKVIEEAYEVNEAHQALADGKDSKDHLAHEAADLVYHLFVLLASADVTPAEVYAILERRHALPSGPRAGNP